MSHAYGDQKALAGVSLHVMPGCVFGLLGPNGSGKTTLFRILTTLLAPDAGSVTVAGSNPQSDGHQVRAQLGAVYQDTALDDELTVEENLRFHGALYGLKPADLNKRIDELLARFSLTERRSSYVKSLSGGLQRRTDLCRGLLHRPAVLLLDEPTTGLDPAARHAFWSILLHIQKQENTTILLATHLMEEAERCDEIAIMDRGAVVTQGAPDDLTAAMGSDVLLLESDTPSALRDHIEAQFGVEAHVVGSLVQVTNGDIHHLMGSLYEAFGELIQSATIRKPTLEDVFMAHAGYHLEGGAARFTESTLQL